MGEKEGTIRQMERTGRGERGLFRPADLVTEKRGLIAFVLLCLLMLKPGLS